VTGAQYALRSCARFAALTVAMAAVYVLAHVVATVPLLVMGL